MNVKFCLKTDKHAHREKDMSKNSIPLLLPLAVGINETVPSLCPNGLL